MEIQYTKILNSKRLELGGNVWPIVYFPGKVGIKNRHFSDADGDWVMEFCQSSIMLARLLDLNAMCCPGFPRLSISQA